MIWCVEGFVVVTGSTQAEGNIYPGHWHTTRDFTGVCTPAASLSRDVQGEPLPELTPSGARGRCLLCGQGLPSTTRVRPRCVTF